MSRVAVGVVTGLGFLGAGTILKDADTPIHGLTTAAGIWAVGAVGMAIRSGIYVLGLVTAATGLRARVSGARRRAHGRDISRAC